MAQLVADGQAHGVPIAAVLTPAEALQSEHLAEVGALVDTEVAPGVHARVPVGYWVVDGEHAGYRTPAPAIGSSDVVSRHRPPGRWVHGHSMASGSSIWVSSSPAVS